MDKTAFGYQNNQNKSNKKPMIIIVFIILVVIVAGIVIALQPKKTDKKNSEIAVTKEPSPTEKPKIDKTSVKIQVLNGSGTAGQAGLVVKALEEAGYASDNIKSANAKEFDNSVTTISSRVDFEEIVNNIKAVLKPTFEEITTGSELDEDSEFDVIVLTGGKITITVTPEISVTPAENTTPTPTLTSAPTPTATPTSEPTPTL